ncbi:hypothetical protein PRIC1_002556 [Phytophthora ramorum]|uniref:Uncharacterized protein n=1 Tax=Phytophthora ramorum TaxID=164328 RepID=H3GG10_PHYRM|nr:hypothetical protein KRP23_887 [Phytophthora ramorum]KAH7503133.1 hypothetical protein KRP22_6189 [Phytophthora ramorum]
MAMENRLATRREGAGGDSNMPRVGAVAAADNDNEDDKVYYGFGVFMGLPLADLKGMKDDFVEQQALTGGPPRHALPSSGTMDGRTHRVNGQDADYERQEDVRMAPPHAQQQRVNGYERQRGEGQSREYADERGARYAQVPADGAERDDDGEDPNSDDGSDYGQKSHSLNFILH